MIFTYELTLTKLDELQIKLKQIPALAKIHLPDKPNIYPNLELASHIGNRNLGITFSLGNHYHSGNLEFITQDLGKYLDVIQIQLNITELLIVSGPTVKKIDTLNILNYLSSSEIKAKMRPELTISVAYNCNSSDQTKENERLIKKLEHQIVNKVYIQITNNFQKITAGIKFIQSLNAVIEICVCIFEPTKASLAKFIFRPWKGVVLSDRFLRSEKNAKQINQINQQKLNQLNLNVILN